ncbi:uncharacterized protein LOC141802867 [Halichoeres trimaculatus]|uniref:uncharacterized protein LOC141802867 n=1 Tax=Halichoeres trimaculatus TaxID=147232 RepID=UPI003D9E3E64
MNLWFSSLLLVVGLFLSSSAQSVEECRPLVTPLPTFEPRFGKWTFIMGYINSEPFKKLFRTTLSQWIDFRRTSPDDRELIEDIGIRHTTHCKYGSSPFTVVRNFAVTDKSGFSCTFHSLPTCKSCLVYTVNSRNTNELLHIMNITTPKSIDEVKDYRALYLMSKRSTVCDDELERFKEQARCLGFTGEPDFEYDPKHSFCNKTIDN